MSGDINLNFFLFMPVLRDQLVLSTINHVASFLQIPFGCSQIPECLVECLSANGGSDEKSKMSPLVLALSGLALPEKYLKCHLMIFTIVLTLCHNNKIPEIIDLQRAKSYLGLQF